MFILTNKEGKARRNLNLGKRQGVQNTVKHFLVEVIIHIVSLRTSELISVSAKYLIAQVCKYMCIFKYALMSKRAVVKNPQRCLAERRATGEETDKSCSSGVSWGFYQHRHGLFCLMQRSFFDSGRYIVCTPS